MKSKSKPDIVVLNWRDIDKFCRNVTEKIKHSGYKPDIIIGVQRGGCIPAVFIAHLLGISNFCTLSVRTTISEEAKAARKKPIVKTNSSLNGIKGKRVLLIDDVTDTGDTIMASKNCLLKYKCKELKVATMVWDMTTSKKTCKADFYGEKIDAWVTFPWEIE